MEPPRHTWLDKATAVVWVIFCFELGAFLLVFPWLDYWENSFFSNLGFLGQGWEKIWDSPWFRGAVSGIGVVNLFISMVEVFRLRRFAPAPERSPEPLEE
jgi:magnesium-transporting ATPase (P-type)